jgi:hypothetical protein
MAYLLLPVIIGMPTGLLFMIAPVWGMTCQKTMEDLLNRMELPFQAGPSALSYNIILVITSLSVLSISVACLILFFRLESFFGL